ncbi:MAG: hypothetical protein ABSF78_14115 [Candidatus Acidiferrales bacterium]
MIGRMPGGPVFLLLLPQIHKDGTAVLLEDYANVPLSGPTRHTAVDSGFVPIPGAKNGTINFKGELARVTSLRSEPADAPLAASRLFVDDENGTLYILDKSTKQFTPYLRFVDIFPSFLANSGPMGVVSFAFDPDYAKNGKFYTVHSERPGYGPAMPTNAQQPGLNLDGYTVTPSFNRSAEQPHVECVLIEWTDTNIRNATFEGTARELLRIGFNHGSHIMGDLTFNPIAHRGDRDYGNLYVTVGEDFAGEIAGPGQTLAQQLQGKPSRNSSIFFTGKFCGSLLTSVCVRRTCSAQTAVTGFQPQAPTRIHSSQCPTPAPKSTRTASAIRTV